MLAILTWTQPLLVTPAGPAGGLCDNLLSSSWPCMPVQLVCERVGGGVC
jgi:hypothetical protein